MTKTILHAEVVLREALHVQKTHVPTTDDSWASCKKCGQVAVGGSETFPVWPCDARRLADHLLELGDE